ncbi:MAG: selenocysteine-specific translation elongation factor [Longimicrobiales bacterium]
MRTVTLGTAGHIDHGKTTLVRALTGIDTDRLPEEKRRGITIDLGFAHLDLDGAIRLAIIDVPGHEAFIRNMAAGTSGIDLGLLVIAADEGVCPQTREHVDILDLLGVRPAAIALTKADRVDGDWLQLALEDTRAQLAHTGYAEAPVAVVSAQTGAGLSQLKQQLAQAAQGVALRTSDDFFRMPVDRVFTMRGTGTVLTGTVWSGVVTKDEVATLLPSGLRTRVRGLQCQGQAVSSVCAGERAAVAVAGVPVEAIARGETLVTESDWVGARKASAYVRQLPGAAHPLRDRQRVHVHLGTAAVIARIRLLDGEIKPGAAGWITLQFETPVVTRAGDRFILRSYSPVTTIGGGQVVEWSDRPYRRRTIDLVHLQRMFGSASRDRIDGALALASWRGLDARLLPLHIAETGRAPELVDVAGRVYHAELHDQLASHLLRCLHMLHARHPLRQAVDLETLRHAAPAGTPTALCSYVISSLIRRDKVRALEGGVASPDWTPTLSADVRGLMESVIMRLGAAGLAAPSLAELAAEFGPEVFEVVRMLVGQGVLIQVGTDLFLTSSELEKARQILITALTPGPQGPPGLKSALGLSRKHLIPLLEYFDRTGLTRRIGDLRTLASLEAVSHLGGATP